MKRDGYEVEYFRVMHSAHDESCGWSVLDMVKIQWLATVEDGKEWQKKSW